MCVALKRCTYILLAEENDSLLPEEGARVLNRARFRRATYVFVALDEKERKRKKKGEKKEEKEKKIERTLAISMPTIFLQ